MLKLPKSHSIKVYRSVEVCTHIVQVLAVDGNEKKVHAPTNLLGEKQSSVITG
jgi:hypothetical protein